MATVVRAVINRSPNHIVRETGIYSPRRPRIIAEIRTCGCPLIRK